jgi:hypothetical protein
MAAVVALLILNFVDEHFNVAWIRGPRWPPSHISPDHSARPRVHLASPEVCSGSRPVSFEPPTRRAQNGPGVVHAGAANLGESLLPAG